MNFAPIVLFVYDRPLHAEQTLNALLQNKLADQSVLYIYADGASKHVARKTMEQITATRAIIKSKQWCKDVIIKERESNMGLAQSIITGVTEIVNKHGKVIVLEDDLITSPGFLTYMNSALCIYENEKNVWHISAYWYPAKKSERLPATFFYNTASCWGWGTWKRAWDNLITDPVYLAENISIKPRGVYHFNIENAYPFFDQLTANINKSINTWAIMWYGSIFLNGALSLHPNHSLVNNIGNDGSGINCALSGEYWWKDLAGTIEVIKKPLTESTLSRKLFKRYFAAINESHKIPVSLVKRIKSKIYKTIQTYLRKKGYGLIVLEKDELHKLKNAERYHQQTIELLGKDFLIGDGKSFYYSYKEIFEDEIYSFHASSDSPTIIDCGSNYGTSILYFKTMFPNANIVGFEPDPYIFNILKRNTEYYGFENITLHNKGLWKDDILLNFISDKADGGRFDTDQNIDGKEYIQVEAVRLSRFLKDRDVDFLKIDIEGAEIEVLSESEKYLKNVSKIFIEYHSFSGKEQRLDILLSILNRNEFRYQIKTVYSSQKPFIEGSNNTEMDLQLNIFAYRG